MKCSSCGRDSSGKYCQYCGEKLFAGGIQYCSQCGSKVAAGSPFCSQCGCRLSAPAENADTARSKNCPACGKSLSSAAKQCQYCHYTYKSPDFRQSTTEGSSELILDWEDALAGIIVVVFAFALMIGGLIMPNGFWLILLGFIVFCCIWMPAIYHAVKEENTGLMLLLIFFPIVGVPIYCFSESTMTRAEYEEKKRKQREVAPELQEKEARSQKEYEQKIEQERLAELADPTPLWITILDVLYLIACILFFMISLVMPVWVTAEFGGGTVRGGFWILLLSTVISLVIAFCAGRFPVKNRKWRWFSIYTFRLFVGLGVTLAVITLIVMVLNFRS